MLFDILKAFVEKYFTETMVTTKMVQNNLKEEMMLKICLSLSLLFLLVGCGSLGLSNPFDGSSRERSTAPENAMHYLCEHNKHFYVRMLNNGQDVWLIYPDHELDLPKMASGDKRYSNGKAILDLSGLEATLTDGDAINYQGCKVEQIKK